MNEEITSPRVLLVSEGKAQEVDLKEALKQEDREDLATGNVGQDEYPV